MKNLIFSVLFSFFCVSIFAQLQAPVACSSCNYGYKQLGTRTLVGAKRAYYGSEKKDTKADFSATPTTTDRKLSLQDIYPGMDGKALFWNYDETGTAHLTELDSSVAVFKRNGSTYAWACENLLQIAAYGKPKPAQAVNSENSEPKKESVSYTHNTNVHHEDNITFYNNFDVVTSPDVVYVKPKLVQVQVLKTSYDRCGRRGGIGTAYDQDNNALVIEMTMQEFLKLQEFGGMPVITDAPRYTDNRLMWGRNFTYLKI